MATLRQPSHIHKWSELTWEMRDMLEVDQITVGYVKGIDILRGVSLSAERGRVTVIHKVYFKVHGCQAEF